MPLTEKDIKRYSAIILIIILAFLAYIVVKPILLAIIAGVLLAYIFTPLYNKMLQLVRKPDVAASLVSIFIIALILVPAWFFTPVMIQQLLNIARYSQDLDIHTVVIKTLPSASEQTISQITLALTSTFAKINALVLSSLVDFIVNFIIFSFQILIAAFVFYFALRDGQKLKEFVLGLSPLSRSQEKILTDQFEAITKSLIYGQVIIGLLEGIFVGIGFLLFGIPNALLLTILAVVLGVFPVIGPTIIYLPVTLYLLITGNTFTAILYFLYNSIILAYLDHILRAQLVARKTSISQALVLVGLIGGVFAFGVMGLILGPLILIYFVHFLKAYKDKNLSSLFASEDS